MKNKMKIYEKGLEQYSKQDVLLGNFLMILWIALGFVACRFFSPLAAWIYLIFAVVMVGAVLRKLLCANCYYYGRRCCLGWGRCSALFFKKGSVEKFNESLGQKLAPLTYGILSAVPVIFIVISLFQKFSIVKLAVLIFLLLISFYSGTINRKKTCARCKMKLFCKGSAVK